MNSQPPPAAAASDQHLALRGVFDGIRDEVLQETAQQAAVGPHCKRAANKLERQLLLLRQRGEFDLELAQKLVDRKTNNLRLHGAGIEPRNLEQRTENLLYRVERSV